MNILIPIGGIGRRFREAGYTRPKALVNVFGKSIIWHLLSNLNIKKCHTIIIPYNKEYLRYNFEELMRNIFPEVNFKFICLEQNTRGAAESIAIALEGMTDSDRVKPVLCLDSDNFFTDDIISLWNGENKVFTFQDNGENPIYSYVKIDSSNILEIQEKSRISDLACCGAYGFSNGEILMKTIQEVISLDKRVKGEFYTSVVIQHMINSGFSFNNEEIKEGKYICLGTPLLLKMFYNNFPRLGSIGDNETIRPLRICFDLDNTLVSYPEIYGDYSTVKPIHNNINFLRYLKTFGNTIIIYTARRMRTHSGNIGKVMTDIGKVTLDTLEKFDIPYDELYFGKPYAHYYIDDLAINAGANIQREIGFYDDFVKPREFHNIETKNVSVVQKNGTQESLSGEIYYYQNIPRKIKDLFPVFFNSNEEGTSFEIEKIPGITVSQLFVDELLQENTLIHVLRSLVRIHNCEINGTNGINDINIYENYSNKLRDRYTKHRDIYDKFPSSSQTYTQLIKSLQDYESEDMGTCCVIHGDPVFTNILINKYDKIKFIDMRGKLDKLSILGDNLYDFAKVYQSLIGYDSILLEKQENMLMEYCDKMIDVFKNWFIEEYSVKRFNWLKIITRSLVFSLVPIHYPENPEKCAKFYRLLESDNLKITC